MSMRQLFLAVAAFLLQQSSFAYAASEAYCEFDSEDFNTGQSSSVVPFFLDLNLGENEFSSKQLVKIDGKDFVARIYGTGIADVFTLSLEIQASEGSFFPRGAASFYADGRKYMLALVEGMNVLKFRCYAR